MDQDRNAFPIYLVLVKLQVSFYGRKELASNNDDRSNSGDNNNNYNNNIKIIAIIREM